LRMSTNSDYEYIIDAMRAAKPEELPGIIAKEIKKVASPSFFMAIADRADKASSDAERDALGRLATEATEILQELLKVAEGQMDQAGKVVEAIVVSAAEPDGQFLVPLSAERKTAMKMVADGGEGERLPFCFLLFLLSDSHPCISLLLQIFLFGDQHLPYLPNIFLLWGVVLHCIQNVPF